ncbi:hypothetical protein [Streptomyces phaeoluteigriseus]
MDKVSDLAEKYPDTFRPVHLLARKGRGASSGPADAEGLSGEIGRGGWPRCTFR